MRRLSGSFFLVLILVISLTGCLDVTVSTPKGFAALAVDDQFAAMSPEGMVFRVRVFENTPQQSLEFWNEALQNHLSKEGYLLTADQTGFTANGISGTYAEWSVPYGTDTYKYLTATLVGDETIAVAEATGRHDIYAIHKPAIIESLESIDFTDVDPLETTYIDAPRPESGARAAGPQYVAGRSGSSSSRQSGCFVADTPILTAGGIVPIRAVWPGTVLTAFDPESQAWQEQTVTQTIELAYSGEVITIDVGDKTVEATVRHPFLVRRGRQLAKRPLPSELSAIESISPTEGRWVEAGHLRTGDVLVGEHGRDAVVTALARETRDTMVYHLQVDGPHTFAVGSTGLVVHNASSAEASGKPPADSEAAVRERTILGSGAVASALPTDAQDDRVRVYSGAASLMIDRVEEAKREIADLAESIGGYVEQSSDSRIAVRVPAATFRDTFDSILDMGEVLYKSIETYDVTAQYNDPSGRLAVAIRARDRLLVLLDKVEDPAERLAMLKQIREYTETIERLELSLQVLEQRIAMSRITVELQSRLAQVETDDQPIPFAWIENLHPLYESTRALGQKAQIDFPQDVAVFEQDGVVRAEAADGTRIRVGTVRNDPEGDSLFWQRALIYHLSSRYDTAEERNPGEVNLGFFKSKDKDPYFYLVGAVPHSDEPTLIVVEIYFPDQQAVERHLDDLLVTCEGVTPR